MIRAKAKTIGHIRITIGQTTGKMIGPMIGKMTGQVIGKMTGRVIGTMTGHVTRITIGPAIGKMTGLLTRKMVGPMIGPNQTTGKTKATGMTAMAGMITEVVIGTRAETVGELRRFDLDAGTIGRPIATALYYPVARALYCPAARILGYSVQLALSSRKVRVLLLLCGDLRN